MKQSILLLLLALGLLNSCKQKELSSQKNFVIILVDDLGIGDLQSYRKLYEENKEIVAPAPTPQLDKLASEGVVCTRAYATAWCAPSRQSLLSGMFTNRKSAYNQRTHKSEPQAVSCRVPLIIRYSEKPENRKSDLIISTFDLMTTLLGLKGIEAPEICQGQNLTQAIYRKNDDAVQFTPLYQFDHNWRGIYTPEYTYAYSVLPNDEADTVSSCLYNRTTDPYEQQNLFRSPEYQKLKVDLYRQILEWMAKFDDRVDVWIDVLKQIVSKKDYDMLTIDKAWFEGSGATGALKGRDLLM